MDHPQEFKPLLAMAETYITEACPEITPEALAYLRQIMDHYITDILSYERASTIFMEKAGTARPIERVSAILHVPEAPIQPSNDQPFPVFAFSRKKTHPWTEYEDQRLLCAIQKFGLDNWAAVSQFVGNMRSRAQCSQRWFRGLDPRISKVLWSSAEEKKLVELVGLYGDRAWTKISSELGNRSDAQCRYHYRQMIKDGLVESSDGESVRATPGPQIQSVMSAPTRRLRREVSGIHPSMTIPPSKEAPQKCVLPPITDIMGAEARVMPLAVDRPPIPLPARYQHHNDPPAMPSVV